MASALASKWPEATSLVVASPSLGWPIVLSGQNDRLACAKDAVDGVLVQKRFWIILQGLQMSKALGPSGKETKTCVSQCALAYRR